MPPAEPLSKSECAAGAATGFEVGGGGAWGSISTSTYDAGKIPGEQIIKITL